MAELFFKTERDTDFFNVCRSILLEDRTLSVTEAACRAVQQPAKSFYLHPREYGCIIRRKGRKLPKNQLKQELHLEILRQYGEIKKRRSKLDAGRIAKIISERPAPRFYMSESRAASLYYELLRQLQS